MSERMSVPLRGPTREYVCGFMVDDSERVVLLRKLKPDWQRGLLNGVGGRVEPGESPRAAMLREWGDETGDDTVWPWRRFALQRSGTYAAQPYLVDFYVARVKRLPELPPANDAGEAFAVRHLDWIAASRNCCVPNLPWLLLAACRDPLPLIIEAVECHGGTESATDGGHRAIPVRPFDPVSRPGRM